MHIIFSESEVQKFIDSHVPSEMYPLDTAEVEYDHGIGYYPPETEDATTIVFWTPNEDGGPVCAVASTMMVFPGIEALDANDLWKTLKSLVRK